MLFSAGNVQAYQITTPSLPQGVVMTTSGSAIASPQQLTEEAARKRELRLLKNRCIEIPRYYINLFHPRYTFLIRFSESLLMKKVGGRNRQENAA